MHLIANIDDHQARTFDTLESLQHCPVLNGSGRRSCVSRGDARQHLGAHVIAELWFLPKELSNGNAHNLVHPCGHSIRLAQHALPCIHIIGIDEHTRQPAPGGAVGITADQIQAILTAHCQPPVQVEVQTVH